jgi:hypothetical protein
MYTRLLSSNFYDPLGSQIHLEAVGGSGEYGFGDADGTTLHSLSSDVLFVERCNEESRYRLNFSVL